MLSLPFPPSPSPLFNKRNKRYAYREIALLQTFVFKDIEKQNYNEMQLDPTRVTDYAVRSLFVS